MNHDTKKMALCALLTVVTASLRIPSTPSTTRADADGQQVSLQDAQTRVRELWEQVLTAKGGRERLSKISSLYVAAHQGHALRSFTADQARVYFPIPALNIPLLIPFAHDLAWLQHVFDEVFARELRADEGEIRPHGSALPGQGMAFHAGDTRLVKKHALATD